MSLIPKYHQNWNVRRNWNVTKAEISLKLKSLKLKFCKNWNVTKTEVSLKLKWHWNWNVTKTEKAPKLKYQQNYEMSLQLKCHQNWNVTKTKNFTKTEMSLKLKCHHNWNVTKTEMLPSLKRFKNLKVSLKDKFKSKFYPGDRHWSPWSCCIKIYLNIMKNLTNFFTLHVASPVQFLIKQFNEKIQIIWVDTVFLHFHILK